LCSDGDRGQAAAPLEGPTSNASDAVWNVNGGQTCAPIEGTTPNAGDSLRDGDRGQAAAHIEGPTSNASDAVGDIDQGQPAAPTEGIIPNAGHWQPLNFIWYDQLALSRGVAIGNRYQTIIIDEVE